VVDDIQNNNSIALTFSGKVQNNTANYTLQLKDLKDKKDT
jgi:hypothetical protein